MTSRKPNVFRKRPPDWYVDHRLKFLEWRQQNGDVLKQLSILYLRQRGKCAYCKSPMWLERDQAAYSATKDHYVSKANGGPSSEDNYVCSCLSCNNKKSHHSANWFVQNVVRAEEICA